MPRRASYVFEGLHEALAGVAWGQGQRHCFGCDDDRATALTTLAWATLTAEDVYMVPMRIVRQQLRQ